MAYSHARDFLFCDICGTQLRLSNPQYAECPLCNFKRPAEDIAGKEIRYTITAEDIARDLKINPFILQNKFSMGEEEKHQKKVIDMRCPNRDCTSSQLEYYTRQMRSADEGETAFYECPKCKHHFQE